MLFLLEALLIIILFASYYMHGRSYLNPAVLFTASFAFSVIWAIAYRNVWELNLGYNTFLVILGGAAEFMLVSFSVHCVVHKKSNGVIAVSQGNTYFQKISNFRLLVFTGLAVISLVLIFRQMQHITGASGFTKVISVYRNSMADPNTAVKISGIAYYLNVLMNAAGYWFGYSIGNQLGRKKFPQIMMIVIYLICLVFSILSGGRNDLICMLLTVFISWTISANRAKGWDCQPMRPRTLVLIILGAAAGLAGFAFLTSLIGRVVSRDYYLYYLAIYCGASIKNLNTFLSAPFQMSDIWGKMTFIYAIRWLGIRLGISEFTYTVVLPYQTVNGRNLGNVFSTYYAFISDFGYFGVFFLIALMAVICQLIYEKAVSDSRHTGLFMVLYCYLAGPIVFSFFSNKFYETVFNIGFIKNILIWICMGLFFERLRVNMEALS